MVQFSFSGEWERSRHRSMVFRLSISSLEVLNFVNFHFVSLTESDYLM